jgi:hypothetical protein
LPEKEHPGTLGKSKLFPEDQAEMEHSRLLMLPESLRERVESFDTEDLPNFLYTVILVTNAMLHLGIFPPLV